MLFAYIEVFCVARTRLLKGLTHRDLRAQYSLLELTAACALGNRRGCKYYRKNIIVRL